MSQRACRGAEHQREETGTVSASPTMKESPTAGRRCIEIGQIYVRKAHFPILCHYCLAQFISRQHLGSPRLPEEIPWCKIAQPLSVAGDAT